MCILCVVGLAIYVHGISGRTEAIECIREAGGIVGFSDEYDASGNPVYGPFIPVRKRSFVERCAEIAGKERFFEVRHVDLRDSEIVDADLQILSNLPDIRMLLIERTDITDSGIQHLKALKSLRMLGLQDTRVTEEGFNELKQHLPALKTYRSFEFERLVRILEAVAGSSCEDNTGEEKRRKKVSGNRKGVSTAL